MSPLKQSYNCSFQGHSTPTFAVIFQVNNSKRFSFESTTTLTRRLTASCLIALLPQDTATTATYIFQPLQFAASTQTTYLHVGREEAACKKRPLYMDCHMYTHDLPSSLHIRCRPFSRVCFVSSLVKMKCIPIRQNRNTKRRKASLANCVFRSRVFDNSTSITTTRASGLLSIR